ncbi:MAG: hypothetical protein MUF52_09670 [Syntrophobacteraceae bacterium]|nr:hypothetical protein [Syntrophobacteraceae bacterium]
MHLTGAIRGLMISSLAWLLLQGGSAGGAEWYLTPSITLSEEYNSNVLFSRSNKLDDFITRVSPALEGRRDTETSRMGLEMVLNGEKYVLNPELDSIDGSARASWAHSWTPRLETTLNTLVARDQTLDTELEETGVFAARRERNRLGADGAVGWALTERWSLGASFLARHDHYPDGGALDLTALTGGISPSWRITERDTGGLVLSLSRADYENSTLDRTASAGLSWERKLSEANRLSVQAGYRYTFLDQDVLAPILFQGPDGSPGIRVERRSESLTDQGLTFGVRLEKDWGPRTATSLSAGRDHASTADATSVDRTYVRATTRFRLTERTSLRADLGYDLSTELGGIERDTHYIRGAPSLSYQVTPHLSVTLGAAYEHAYEDRPVDSFSRNRLRTWISLSSSWPRLWGKLGSL